jgi:hypothetical protein
LGEQCFYRQTCKHYDPHSACVQVDHNAICQCETGYHSVSYTKPYRKVFCTEGKTESVRIESDFEVTRHRVADLALLTADMPTMLGVCSGIAILAGLLCLVLHLYTRGRNPQTRPHHFADAHLPPPMYFTSETGTVGPFQLLHSNQATFLFFLFSKTKSF